MKFGTSLIRRSQAIVGVLAVLLLSMAVAPPAGAAPQRDEEYTQPNCKPGTGYRCGYITLPDGAALSYNLKLPMVDGEEVMGVPTLLFYQGYVLSIGDVADRFDLLDRGYALMNLNPRGTVCSSGQWVPFQHQEALDAKYVIDEWIPNQEWSNGVVAMAGESFSGITSLPVAALRPEHLVAVVTAHTVGDFYRDVIRPGGILNQGAPAAFGGVQGAFSTVAMQTEVKTEAGVPLIYPSDPHRTIDELVGQLGVDPNHPDRDRSTKCAQHVAQRSADNLTSTPFTRFALHEYDDDEMQEISTADNVEDIDVPVLLIGAWQDQLAGARAIDSLSGIKRLHAVLTNGDHWAIEAPDLVEEIASFLDHYVLGLDNGYDEEDPIEVWWETGRSSPLEAGWKTSFGQWPPPQAKVTEFFLSGRGNVPGEGALVGSEAAVESGSDPYSYAGATGQNNAQRANKGGLPEGTWNAPARPGASLTYTTGTLEGDLAVIGSASLDMWLASTAVDTDVQVTISEIRDYGDGRLKEVYVQQGWLRASHRALDEERSTDTRPFHSHQESDSGFNNLLTPGEATEMRVEILPFAHVFRAGSRLRVTIDAPKSVPDLWYLVALPVPAVNNVVHEPGRISKVVLPVLPGKMDDMPREYPGCAALVTQPCRSAVI